jgi:hypothetical protein
MLYLGWRIDYVDDVSVELEMLWNDVRWHLTGISFGVVLMTYELAKLHLLTPPITATTPRRGHTL